MMRRVCVCALIGILFPLHHEAQQPDAGSAQPPQVQPGSNPDAGSTSSDKKLSGLAAVIKISPIGGNPLFHADGYRIRVVAGTVTAFGDPLKSLADVAPGTWMRFEGVRDDTGILVARKAEFFPPGTRKALTAMGPRKTKKVTDYQPITQDSLLDADGHFVNVHTKVRLSDTGPCGWHRVPADLALQERVERIGMRLVPEFQKQLPLDSPARIPFRFYVVADDKTRSVFACDVGLVLVPKNVVKRLQNDDQLAAVLADGVAFQLERQLVSLSLLDMVGLGSEAVEFIPPLYPAGYIAGEAIAGIAGHEKEARLERELARTALQLLAEAGFDPWQAPEAWRLLAPKGTPRDVSKLKYTREGKYQLTVLNVQYKQDNSGSSVMLPASLAGKEN